MFVRILSFVNIIQIVLSMKTHNTIETKNWVVVVSVSEWYDDIFHNWLIWYKRLDLDMKTIVIAEDFVTYKKYENCTDFTTLYFEMEEVGFNLIAKSTHRVCVVCQFFLIEIIGSI